MRVPLEENMINPFMGPLGPLWALHWAIGGPALGPLWALPWALVGPALGPLLGPPLGPCWAFPLVRIYLLYIYIYIYVYVHIYIYIHIIYIYIYILGPTRMLHITNLEGSTGPQERFQRVKSWG